jgi:hypothetical protein
MTEDIKAIKYSVTPEIAEYMNELCAMIEADIAKQCGPLPPVLMVSLVGNIIESYGESIASMAGNEVEQNEPLN